MNGVTIFWKDFAPNYSAVAKPFFMKSRLKSFLELRMIDQNVKIPV